MPSRKLLIIGHRGARGLAPENTLVGVDKAVSHNVDQIEVDLRVADATDEKVVILHHDAKVREPNGTKHLIKNTKYSELRKYKPDLPTLDELFMSMQSHKNISLYLEVKPEVLIQPIVATIKAYLSDGFDIKNIFLGSKSQKTLVELHHALPDAPKIVIEPWSGVRAHKRARQVDAKIIAMNQRWLWWGFIRGFKNSNIQLFAYTLNDPKKARRWAKWGLSGAVTDYPDRFEK